MGPYEPLAMKPRTWEHKSEAIKLFLLLQPPIYYLLYLKMVLFWRLILWEFRHEDRAWRLLSGLRVRGSAASSARTTTHRQLSGSLSQRAARVRVEPMTEPTTPTCGQLPKKNGQKQLLSVNLIIFYYSYQTLDASSKYAGPSVSRHNDDILQISLIKCQHYVQKDNTNSQSYLHDSFQKGQIINSNGHLQKNV